MPRQPRFLHAEFEARPLPEWPAGFYSLAPGFQVFPVFLAELPATRETLPLRPDALFMHRLAATLRLLADRDNNMPQAGRSILMSELTLELNRLEDEAFSRGKQEGAQKMLRQMVADFCDLLDIPLTSERCTHIAGLSTTELSDLCSFIKQHRAWPCT